MPRIPTKELDIIFLFRGTILFTNLVMVKLAHHALRPGTGRKVFVFLDIVGESAFIENTEHNFRHLAETKLGTIGQVTNFAGFQVYLQRITVIDSLGIADKYRKPDIDGVAEEDTGD